ncbi:MAG: hypothetical protein SGPRY_010717 [Prymnesium sp.]
MECSLAIVGGGPCGLAVLSRLAREAEAPSSGRLAGSRARHILQRTLVIDPSGWLSSWRCKLTSQGVSTLRSPTFVHPHPSRVSDEALREFAIRRGYPLTPIQGLQASRSEWTSCSPAAFDDFCSELLRGVKERLPLSTIPSRQHLTAAHVYRATVIDILPLPPSGGHAPLKLILSDGLPSIIAAHVVLAVSDGGAHLLPEWYAEARAAAPPRHSLLHASELAGCHSLAPLHAERGREECELKVQRHGAPSVQRLAHRCHRAARTAARLLLAPASFFPFKSMEPLNLLERALAGRAALSPVLAYLARKRSVPEAMRRSGGGRLIVFGGGLSAAQLAIHALSLGWRRVVLVSRAALVVRPFDLELCWIERHRLPALLPAEQEFFSSSCARRRELLRHARPGGSVTPACMQELRRLQTRGGLVVEENTTVTAAEWRRGEEAAAAAQSLETTRLLGVIPSSWTVSLVDSNGWERIAHADAIWMATGSRLEVASQPLLQSVRKLSPAPEHGGLPQLTPALRWCESMPLYIAGAMSALQVGPDALTLGGAAAAASRIVSDLLQIS